MTSHSTGTGQTAFDISAIYEARGLISNHVRRTPMKQSETLTKLFGFDVYVKYEIFQKTGSFKPRGAFNKMLRLSEHERAAGVVAVSGGNHAQAVAYAASTLGIKAVVLMPENTPNVYLDATRGYGAEVDLQPSIADAFAKIEHYTNDGMTFVHPFDDPLVIAGQGTVGLEIMEDLPETTDVIASIGGGGMACGVAAAVKGVEPSARIWGVETEGADAMAQALALGRPVDLPAITSIAKTLGAPSVSAFTLELAERLLENVTVVSDVEAVKAMAFILERLKVITEPAAACTLSAAHRLRENFGPTTRLVLVFCGGNAGPGDLCGYLERFGAA
ncbi:MAG: threonine/serine dehydratase [Acidobacteria bacterium]|nr:threonine/serine dehydratase [Acidobacteriota bacterium]